MGAANRFYVGKSYQFTGDPIGLSEGESFLTKVGAVQESLVPFDIEIYENWMDRKIRKCIYVDPRKGTSAIFEDIYVTVDGLKKAWSVPRGYDCYLSRGMFQEVEFTR